MSQPARPTDLVNDLFRHVTLERLLDDPRANGEGVRVCVIDTGVDQGILAERHRARGEELKPIVGAIFTGGTAEPRPYAGRASAPHGTTVADIVLNVAPRVELFSADVFGPTGTCQVETLVTAIRWAMDHWQCHILNLSLGVSEERLRQLPRRHLLLRTVEDAYYRDVLLFAAAHNDHPLLHSYPASFGPALISVDKGDFRNRTDFRYRLLQGIEFQAFSRGYLGPFVHQAATSWATPHLAGIAARILSLHPHMKPFEMKTILYWLGEYKKSGRDA